MHKRSYEIFPDFVGLRPQPDAGHVLQSTRAISGRAYAENIEHGVENG